MNRRTVRGPYRPARTAAAGSVLIEALVATVIFSVGMVGALLLLATAIRETGNAGYRARASLLADEAIGQMWTGDRTLSSLQSRFGSTGSDYLAWIDRVKAQLPGVTSTVNTPDISVDSVGTVTVKVRWQAPGESAAHVFVTTTRIAGEAASAL